MTRKFVDFGLFPGLATFYDYKIAGAGSRMQDAMQVFRDRVRAALDPSATGLQWSVSDIVKWQGLNANNHGWMFQIIHKNGSGVITGHVWTFVWVLPENAETYPYIGHAVMANNGTTFSQNVMRMNGNTSYINNDFSPLVFYSSNYTRVGRFTGTQSGAPTLGTWQLQGDATIHGVITADNGGGDWTLRLDGGRRLRVGDTIEDSLGETLAISGVTYDHCWDTKFEDHNTGACFTGDWLDTPGVSPYSAWTNFIMASPLVPQLYGVCFEGDNGINDRGYAFNMAIVTDDTEPFVMFLACVGDRPIVSVYALMGDILLPSNAGDSYSQAILFGDCDTADFLDNHISHCYACWVYGDYPSGTPGSSTVTYASVRWIDRFTTINERNMAGDYITDVVVTDVGNEIKAQFKETCARVYGGYRIANGSVIDDGTDCFLRIARPLALPFIIGESQWPSGLRFQNKFSIQNVTP